MEMIYGFMDTVLPFEWASHMFMKHALLAILLVTPLFGLLSTMVVSNRMAFFSDSLGGVNSYFGKKHFRAYMGDVIEMIAPKHIMESIRMMYTVTVMFILIASALFGL